MKNTHLFYYLILSLLLKICSSQSSVYTTGSNLSGQLGKLNNLKPNLLSIPGKTIKFVCVGQEHVVIVTNTNELYTWGDNKRFSVGFNSQTDQYYTPQLLFTSPNPINDLVCGEAHTLVIINSSLIYGFGEGTNAALGTGNNQHVRTISEINAIQGRQFNKFFAFGTNSYALEQPSSRVFGWGQNVDFQLGVENTGNNIRFDPVLVLNTSTQAVAGDTSFTLILDGTGDVWACGSNIGGRLGINNNTQTSQRFPILVPTLKSSGKKFSLISSGGSSSFALATDGTLYAWGANSNGQLGLPPQTTISNPTVVPRGEITGTITSISVSKFHTLILNDAGRLFATGLNDQGQLGIDSYVSQINDFKLISSTLTFRSVRSSTTNTYAIGTDGNLYVWGGSLKFGLPIVQTVLEKISFDPVVNITKVFAGSQISFAVDSNQTLWGWGLNTPRLLTANDFIDRFYPLKVAGAGSLRIDELSVGGLDSINIGHVLALVSNPQNPTRVPFSWGKNSRGQLGNQEVSDRIVPTQVSLTNSLVVKKYSAGAEHSILIANPDNNQFNKYYVWGDNRFGQIGIGGIQQSSFVRTLLDFSDIVDGDAGDYHSVLLLRSGNLTLMGTGNNDFGQLCLGNQDSPSVMTTSTPFSNTFGSQNILSVLSGSRSTWIVTEKNGVWVCGDDTLGTLGMGQQRNYTVPTKHTHPIFSNSTNIHKIIPSKNGGFHTIVITTTGEVYVMGLNSRGQLGLSHTNNVLTPVKLNLPGGDVGLNAAAGRDHSIFILGRVNCPNDCYSNSSRGVCNLFNGVCSCNSTLYYGSDCGFIKCLPDQSCSGNGTCNASTGKCVCNQGYQGDICNQKLCLNNCSGKGTCLYDFGVCKCNAGFTGEDCSKVSGALKSVSTFTLLASMVLIFFTVI